MYDISQMMGPLADQLGMGPTAEWAVSMCKATIEKVVEETGALRRYLESPEVQTALAKVKNVTTNIVHAVTWHAAQACCALGLSALNGSRLYAAAVKAKYVGLVGDYSDEDSAGKAATLTIISLGPIAVVLLAALIIALLSKPRKRRPRRT